MFSILILALYTKNCMNCSRSRGLLLLFLGSALFPTVAVAQMQSTSYQISWDAVSTGGNEQGASTNYQVIDTVGQPLTGGPGASTNYQALDGYRVGDERPLSFEVSTTLDPAVTGTYTDLSVAEKTVTMASSGDVGLFSVGDLVAAIEGTGASQITVVGKITDINGATVTVDRFDGQTASIGSAATGYLLKLGGSSLAFGEVTTASVAVGTVALSAVSDAGGYAIYAQASGQPTNGSHSLTGVSDGTVTAGSEEYGLRSYGETAATAIDTAVTSTAMEVQSSSSRSAIPADRTAVLYKLAIGSDTPSGTYSQTVFFTMTPSY